jgi:drug/metabolite transporter (DMT)-like permease
MFNSTAGLGILFGLLASLLGALSYVLSRRYTLARHVRVTGLMVLAHVIMGGMALATLPLIACPEMPPLSVYLLPLAGTAGFYLVGQFLFMSALRRSEASRVSPLLAIKVVAVAIFSSALFGTVLHWNQWLAVALSIFGAFLLNTWGGRLPRATVLAAFLACISYALCDMCTVEMLLRLDAMGKVRGPIAGAAMQYVACGVLGLLLLPWFGSRRIADWKGAMPYAAVWYGGILFMYPCYNLAGIVLGNIVLGTRGLISIAMGALIARAGHHHLELHVAGHVLRRRVFAALLMLGAIVLFKVQFGAAD